MLKDFEGALGFALLSPDVKITIPVNSGQLSANARVTLKDIKTPTCYVNGGPKDIAFVNVSIACHHQLNCYSCRELPTTNPGPLQPQL
jgi:hypothetical protein